MNDGTEPEREPDESTEDEVVEEPPLNRAARRARAKQSEPSHVGPRNGHGHGGRGPRAHTKRRR